MKLTYYGHSCFSVAVNGKTLLFDPFISANPKASHIDVGTIAADYIFVSHGHGDHIADCVSLAKRTGAMVVAVYEVVNWLQQNGCEKVSAMNTGGRQKFDFGTVRLTSAIHSSQLPDGSYAGNPVGFVIESTEGNFYYSGDTALTYDMQLIPAQCEPLVFCVLPIGDHFTMGVEDAIVAADFCRCDKVVGVHYNTFPPIEIDTREAIKKFEEEEKVLLLPAIGEVIEIADEE